MLLTLDVGNTSIAVGLFQGKRLLAVGRIPTHGPSSYRPSLLALFRRWKVSARDFEGVILSSVVPKAIPSLKRALRGLVSSRPLILGENVKAPIVNRYRIPSQVGQDRLVNAVAAYELYGGPAIVVDFGTAVTIDLVSGRREYLGGLIVPGVEVALEALSSRAALLPRIKLEPPKEFLGRDTVSSMRSGIFFGYGALCDGLVRQLKVKHAPKAKVIATGGHCRLLAPFCKTVQTVNPNLTLQGLQISYEKIS
jgi:type III pantothenate kinase